MPTNTTAIKITSPGIALQQMCNYVAIAETKSPSESLRELILHSLFTFEEEKASSAQDISNILKTIFGIEAPDHQVQEALDQLHTTGRIYMPMGTNYVLTRRARKEIKVRIDQASQLQEQVKQHWVEEIVERFPNLDADRAWSALHDYLGKAFLRHGIQVAVFLMTRIKI